MEKYKHLLCIFQALGMPQEAIVCYQRALQVRPDYAMAFGEFPGFSPALNSAHDA